MKVARTVRREDTRCQLYYNYNHGAVIRPYLLGSALIYAFTGLTSFDSIYSLITSMNIISFDSLPLNNIIPSYIPEKAQVSKIISDSSTYSNDLLNITNTNYSIINEFIINMITLTKEFQLGLSLGLILIFSGLLFKISAAPFHNWSLGLLFFCNTLS